MNYKEEDFKIDDGTVQILRVAFLSLSCCRPKTMPDKELVERVNAMYPCGTTSGWMLPKPETFKEYPSWNTVQCADHADREHVMLDC